jgi:Flp pilus assembly protein TadD
MKRYVLALRQAAIVEPTNFETAYELAETLRKLSFQGLEGYRQLAEEAITWFQRSSRLNPYDPYNQMGIGMCLDWLGQHAEAGPYFERAVTLDPNNYSVLALLGWHLVQREEYAAAKEPLERSLQLQHAWHNPVAAAYLPVVKRKLDETGKSAQSK